MKRAAFVLLLLVGCQRPAFDSPGDEIMLNAPLRPGLAVKVLEGEGGAEFMDDALTISDPGKGGPDRLIQIKIQGGKRDGQSVELRRQCVYPENVRAWYEEHGLKFTPMPPGQSAMATKLEPGEELHVEDIDSDEALPKIPIRIDGEWKELAASDRIRIVADPGGEGAATADEARARLVTVEVIKSLFLASGVKGEVKRGLIAKP